MNSRTVITGTGSYIPEVVRTNQDFVKQSFYSEDNSRIEIPSQVIVEKFKEITGIDERRYAGDNITASDMAIIAAKKAIEDSGIDPEQLDQLIVAHNFGNVPVHTHQADTVPSLAARVKHGLGIKNPNCVVYDILFGCPGWLQGMIHADSFFKAGIAKKAMVIGAETLSRVIDPFDRDSMIYSDGAGAAIVEWKEQDETSSGVVSWSVQSHCMDEAFYLYFGKSFYPGAEPDIRYIKMKGRKVYEYAMQNVPLAMKDCLDKAGIHIREIKKIFIHQANEKMDQGIVKRLFKLYQQDMPVHIMPMNIHKLGNSSVATIPTLYDMVRKNILEDHALQPGDLVLFASVGAGMNINALCYRV